MNNRIELGERLRVLVDTKNMQEGRDISAYLKEKQISYLYIPTRWCIPEIMYGSRIIRGEEEIYAFLEEWVKQ
jgi:hypothetical protein